jgi:hypothetical protein
MLPVKGISSWTPLQRHVFSLIFSNEKKKDIAYEMPKQWGKTTLLLGIVANCFMMKKNMHIVMYGSSCSEMRNYTSRVKEMISVDPSLNLRMYTNHSIKSETTLFELTCNRYYPTIPSESFTLLLIDSVSYLDLEFYKALEHRDSKYQILALYTPSEKFHPFKYTAPGYYASFILIKLYYAHSTHRAMYTWLLCAKKLKVHRDVAHLIAQWLKITISDTIWFSLEYPDI